MDQRDLISDYLVEVADRLGADSTDLVDELEDHLREKADRYVAFGTTHDLAQLRAIEQFGSAPMIAVGLLEAETEGAHVTSSYTRMAGWAGIFAVVTIGLFIALSVASIGFGFEFSDGMWTPFWLLMGTGMLAFGYFASGVGVRGGNRVVQFAAPAVVAIGAIAWFGGDFEYAGIWMTALLATMAALRFALAWRVLDVLAITSVVLLVWTAIQLGTGSNEPTAVQGTLGTIGFAILLTCIAITGLRLTREGAVDPTKDHALTA